MFAKSFVLILALCSSVVFASCGTIGARAMTNNPPPFAGVRADFSTFGDLLKNKDGIAPVWYWMALPLISAIILVDVPVSAVFDVLCLPADLKSQREQAEEKDTSVNE